MMLFFCLFCLCVLSASNLKKFSRYAKSGNSGGKRAYEDDDRDPDFDEEDEHSIFELGNPTSEHLDFEEMDPIVLTERLAISDLLETFLMAIETRDWKLYRRTLDLSASINYSGIGGSAGLTIPDAVAFLSARMDGTFLHQVRVSGPVVLTKLSADGRVLEFRAQVQENTVHPWSVLYSSIHTVIMEVQETETDHWHGHRITSVSEKVESSDLMRILFMAILTSLVCFKLYQPEWRTKKARK